MGAHIDKDGEFQSDKYPSCPAGKVPLSTKDPTAQDLLWEYAQRRRPVDAEFSEDLEAALRAKGFVPPLVMVRQPPPKPAEDYADLARRAAGITASVVAVPNAYRIINIVGGTRRAYVTLAMKGGNIAARVADECVAETAVLLTGVTAVLVTGIVQHHSGEPGLLVERVDPAPEGDRGCP